MRSSKCFLMVLFLLLAGPALGASQADLLVAKKLYERITGVKVSANKAELKAVADLVAQGKHSEAVKVITNSPDFLNVQIKNLSLRLSNKDESVKVPFSDFSALIVGIVKDGKDFREILTADYYYDVTGVANDNDLRTRYFNQSNFSAAETGFLDLTKALVFRPQQQMVTSAFDTTKTQTTLPAVELVSTRPQIDAAGVLTTRTFAERLLSGGTNRRAVEFSLKQFLCVSMADAADSNASDQFVGRDVERFPAGDYNKYLNSCKSCHAVMDGMRGAFAKSDIVAFTNGSNNSVFSNMHGGFFISEGLGAAYSKYLTDVLGASANTLIPDLETNQETSEYYQFRLNYMIGRGTAPASAKATLDSLLNTIRDTKVLTAMIADYRLVKGAKLVEFRTNKDNATYRTNYVKACLDHFSNVALTAIEQEDKFLVCNLDNKKELSELYLHYDADLTTKGTAATEKARLLAKFINQDRDSNTDIVIPYLQAKDQSKLFPRNVFDSDTGVAVKMNKGNFRYGFVVKDDVFVNNATLGSKAALFGWRGPNKEGGKGVKDFGRMLADSRRFSQCMAKRVYENVCAKKVNALVTPTVQRLGDRFEALNYNVKSLYQEIALDPACGIVGATP